MSTWQSRLSAKDNHLSQKLVDNSIILSGVSTEVIIINEMLNGVNDPISLSVENIGVINVIFPSLQDVPMRRFIQNGNGSSSISANDGKDEKEPFICYAPIASTVPQGSILLKFFENPTGDAPWILPLKVADVLGTFGSRTIIYQKLNIVYYDTPINSTLYDWLLTMAQRRSLLGW